MLSETKLIRFVILFINLYIGVIQWRVGVRRQRGIKVWEVGENGTGSERL